MSWRVYCRASQKSPCIWTISSLLERRMKSTCRFGWGVGAIGDSEAEEHVAEQTSEVTRSQSVEEPVTDNDVNAQSSSSQKLLNSIQDNVHSCVVYAYSCIVYCCIVYHALCISACVLRVSFYHSVNCFNLITHDIIKTIHCPVKD